MSHAVLALALLILSACGETSRATLRLLAVEPARGAEGLAVEVELKGEGILAGVFTDFHRAGGSLLDSSVAVTLIAPDGAELPLDEVQYSDATTVRARVPGTAARGLYDVRLTDARGRSDTLTGAFAVVAPADAVARFEFRPVGEQHPNVAFAIRAIALDDTGRLVESFDGTVALTDDTNTVQPATVGPFVRGRLQAFATIGVLTASTVLHARDAAGKVGDSEPFAVVPGPATRVTFAQAPQAADAGACAGPFALRLEDAQGFPSAATADVAVALTAVPALGVEFFSDAACATRASTLTVTAGSDTAQVYVKATTAGLLSLRAAPEGLPSAQAQVMVAPQPPSRLAFSSAPATVAVDTCSAVFEVRAEDALGNVSAPASATLLSVQAMPAAGVAFFDDAACTASLGAPQLDVGTPSLRFFLKSSLAGAVRVDVATPTDGGAALAPASADVEVTP